MDRDKQKDLYKIFIEKCTRTPKSVNNYSDFKRINECIQDLFPDKKDISILDFDDAEEFGKIIERLNNLEKYINYNKTGKDQYSCAVAYYQYYLNAKHIFGSKDNNKILGRKILVNDIETYRSFITAIRSKPFLLLAGISGTGKRFCANFQILHRKNRTF